MGLNSQPEHRAKTQQLNRSSSVDPSAPSVLYLLRFKSQARHDRFFNYLSDLFNRLNLSLKAEINQKIETKRNFAKFGRHF